MHLKKFILTALAFIIFNSFAYGQQYVGDYNTFKKYVREGYSGQPFFNIIVTDNFNANDDLTTDSEQSVSGTINGDNKTLNMKHLYNDRFYRGFILSGGKTLSIYNYSINSALLITEKSSGAAIKIDSSTVNLANVNFEGNRADNKYEDSSINVSRTAYGGSIAASNYSTINATGTIVFAKSYANANTKRYAVHFEAKGGAVYLDNSNMNFSNADVTFRENYVNTGGNGYYYESDFYRRETLGGAIYANNSSIDFLYSSSVSFANNCAVGGTGSDQWKSGKSFYGGAIYLLNSSFNSENTELRASENYVAAPYSHNARGGFLYADSSSVTFGSTTINVNYVTNSSGGSKQGGAIYFNGGDLTFNKYTMFFWNEARSGEGGAIYLNNSSNVNFYGNNTIFDSNSASTGGAFYVNASTVSFSSGSVLFTNNRANNSGGVFYIKGSSLSFTGENVEFSSNTANSGVVLYGQSSIVIFGAGNTCFYGNVSSAGNGIIEIGGGLILDFDNTNIRAYGNKANSGGFLYLRGNSLNFNKDVVMKSNETNTNNGYGGAMYLSDNSAVTFNGISNIFESNKAIYGSGRGGAFYISGSSLSFTNTNGSVKFTSNTVNAEGGAIYLTGNSKLSFTVAETEFNYNEAGSGGAFYLFDAFDSSLRFDTALTAIGNNATSTHGGFMYAESGQDLTFNGSVNFTSNTANSNGGVLYLQGNRNILFTGVGATAEFNYNEAGSGGAFYLRGTNNSSLTFNNALTAIGNNATSTHGGFIYTESGQDLTFNGSVNFTSNTAVTDGGVIYLTGDRNISFAGVGATSEFKYNRARSGGAFYLTGTNNSSLTFNNPLTAIGNIATSSGGFMYTESGQDLTFNGSVNFTSNTAVTDGGVIYLRGNRNILFTGTGATAEFNYNKARSGGAFCLTGTNNSSLTFNNPLTAIGNNATSSGGFIYAEAGQGLTFNGSVNFTSNTAVTDGGVIYLRGNRNILFTGTGATAEFNYNKARSGGAFCLTGTNNSSLTFNNPLTAIGNNATSSGGFIYAEAGQGLTFNGSVKFTSNTASNDGGVIYLRGNRNILFTGTGATSEFKYNRANYGGAFSLNNAYNSSLTFNTALTAIGNRANNAGGFIYSGSGQGLTFNGSVNFTGNTAVTDGGVIYLTGDRNILFTGTGSTAEFNYNNARSGGAFYLTGTNNSSLTFNNPLTAIGNRALNANGGFIYVDSGQDLAFKASVNFTNNTAVTDGGVIYSTGSSNISFAGVGATSEFNYNNAGSGGVFYLRGTSGDSSLTFDTAISATNNIARSKNGGFLNIYLSSASFQKNTDIRNSYAFGGGGAIYASSSVLMFSGDKTEFTNNISSATGGALAILNSALVNFNGLLTSFTENSSKESGSGGAIAIDKSTANFINKEGTVFSKNESALAGGAIYLSNKANLNFSENSVGSQFLGNKASSNGGAVAVTGGSTAKFYNAIFKENQSGGYGGAVSIEGINESNTSSMSFISKNVSGSSMTLFLGNTASSASNAVYLGNFSNTYFIAGSSSSIEMYDGMFGGEGDYINMFFGGEGNFNLYADALISSANITLSGSNGGTFNLYKGASLTAKRLVNEEGSIIKMNSDGKNTINLSEFENNGELEMTAAFNNNENDQILVSGDVTLSSTTSILKIALKNTRFDEKEFNLIYYGNNLSGEFGEIIYDDRVELGTATINYGSGNNDWISILLRGKGKKTRFSFIDGLSRNQYATAVTYDALSLISEENTDLDDIITAIDSLNNDAEIKEALNQASGYFLANVIRSAALGGDSNEVYNRIHDASQYDFAGSGLWAQAKANSANNKKDENSPGDYNDKIIGMMIGYDRYFAENALMFGFYGKYDMHDIKQEPGNEADIKSFGLGFYGGYIKDKWELKGLLSGNFDSYSTSREITFLPTEDRVAEADFTSTTMGFDLEGAYKVGINDDIDFRPYAGFEIRSVNYDQIKENGAQSLNLTVGSGNYARMSARLGAGINRKHNVYGWYINGEYKQLLNGELPEINNNFEGCDYKFTIVGSEEGKGALGVKAGGSYSVLENLMLYANLSYFVAERYDNIYGGFGVRFMMFGAKDGKRKQIERKDDLVAKRSALKQARRQSKIEIAEDNLKYEEDKLLQLQTSLVDKRRIEKDMQEEAKVAVREAQHAEDIFYSLYEPTSEELAQEEKIVKEKLRQEKDAVKAFSDAEKDSRKIEKYIEKQIKKVEKAKATLAKFQSQEEKVVESEKDLEREAERELKRLAKEEEKIKKEELKLKKTQEKKAAAEEKKIQKQIAAEEAAISDLDKEEAKLAKERAAKEKAAKREAERELKNLAKEEEKIRKEELKLKKTQEKKAAAEEKMIQKQIAAEEAAISDLDKEEAKLAKERAAKEKAAKKELERAEKQLLKEEKLIEKERKRIQKEEARLIAEQEKMLEYEAREKEREIESEKKKPKTAEPVKVEKTKEQLKIEAEIAAYEARLAAEKEKSVQKTTKEAAAEKKKAEEERKRKEQENLKKEKEEAKKQAAKLKEAALDKRAKEAAARRFQKVQKAFNLKFTPDNYKLVETAKITIREQAEEIKKLDYEKIIIEGHTDSEEGGSYEGRKKLSRMRAEEVCNEFIANGIPKEKIDFAGLADKVSIGDNKTDLGKIDNRRVEIVVE